MKRAMVLGCALVAVLTVVPVTAGCRGRDGAGETAGIAPSVPAPWGRAGELLVTESFDDGPYAGRRWLTYATAGPGRGGPLVLVLHGGGGSALSTATEYPLGRWQNVAATRPGGMVVVYPEGSAGVDGRQGWNDCRPDAGGIDTDDVGFLVALAERMATARRTDPKQVYIVGISNGGMMALRLAAERPGAIAGVGAIAAAMPAGTCGRPTGAVPAVIVAGTADPVTPFSGGQIASDRGDVVGIRATVAAWRSINRSLRAGTPYIYPDTDRRDGARGSSSTVSRVEYRGEAPVTVFTVDGGGHTVPDREIADPLPRAVVGPQNRDINAVDLIAAAFRLTT